MAARLSSAGHSHTIAAEDSHAARSGLTLEELRAPFDGQVLDIVVTPAISPGEPAALIGQRHAP